MGYPFGSGDAQVGRQMTPEELAAAGIGQPGVIGPDTAGRSALVDETLVGGDPDTKLGGDPFVQSSDDEAKAADVAEVRVLEPVDVFEVDVRYAQDRTYDALPTFDSYDEARDAGIELLHEHADAAAFSIRKSTVLR